MLSGKQIEYVIDSWKKEDRFAKSEKSAKKGSPRRTASTREFVGSAPVTTRN